MQLSDVDTEAAVGRQRFTRQFEQDSFVHSCKVSHIQERQLSLGRGAIYPPFTATLTVLNVRRTRWVTGLFFCQRPYGVVETLAGLRGGLRYPTISQKTREMGAPGRSAGIEPRPI